MVMCVGGFEYSAECMCCVNCVGVERFLCCIIVVGGGDS